jgi:hypothetical protein
MFTHWQTILSFWSWMTLAVTGISKSLVLSKIIVCHAKTSTTQGPQVITFLQNLYEIIQITICRVLVLVEERKCGLENKWVWQSKRCQWSIHQSTRIQNAFGKIRVSYAAVSRLSRQVVNDIDIPPSHMTCIPQPAGIRLVLWQWRYWHSHPVNKQ